MNHLLRLSSAFFVAVCLAGCQGDKADKQVEQTSSENDSAATERILVNQVGFLPAADKWAVVPASAEATQFTVVAADGQTVLQGSVGAPGQWAPADKSVRLADFSALTEPGEYRLQVDGALESFPFRIANDAYQALNDAALKAFYFNRASTELLAEHAGPWARPAGHPDTNVQVHPSAASEARPAGTVISAPKGWYDAGDYNKYIVNSGVTMHNLLAAYEQFPDYYAAQALDIPESGEQGVPDILHEALWNLEWMLAMQDPNDGGVYHKLTTARFEDAVMPHQATAQRFVVAKGTEATLNFAAVMAMASRVYGEYETAFPGLAAQMREAAEQAWAWAQANPAVLYDQSAMNAEFDPDVVTGEYGGANISGARAWAAAELYITTGSDDYYTAIDAAQTENTVPAWGDSRGLVWMSLAQHQSQLSAAADQALISERIVSLADELLARWQGSAWRVTMNHADDFYWGSNSFALNQAMMLIQGYRLDGNREYLSAAQSMLDYVLGRNATGYSFVSGFGSKPAMHPHHRPSYADEVVDPVPGFVMGGPHNEVQEDCGASMYPSDLPALSYIDHWCSYATNEVAINWNAPLVYVTGALQVLWEEN